MSLRAKDSDVITSWTNGRKAIVQLVRLGDGQKVIKKTYRAGFALSMFREYFVTRYAAAKLSIVPKVLGFNPLRRQILLSYVAGQRVLEWVLVNFGESGIHLGDFQSFHGLDYNTKVAEAFAQFRESASLQAKNLRSAIKESYSSLHKLGIVHGSTDPRNVIYDERQVFIIDFDHARPCFNPGKLDGPALQSWFGVRN